MRCYEIKSLGIENVSYFGSHTIFEKRSPHITATMVNHVVTIVYLLPI
jgi:hypothetical protein